MAKRRRSDPLAPLLKLLRPYVSTEDLEVDHHKFLHNVVDRIRQDRQAYTRLRTGIKKHNQLRRDVVIHP